MAIFHRFHCLRAACRSGLYQSAHYKLTASNVCTKVRHLSYSPFKRDFSNEIHSTWCRRSLSSNNVSTMIIRFQKNQQENNYSCDSAQPGESSDEQLSQAKKARGEQLHRTTDNGQIEYFTIYRFPYMKHLRVISRLKLAQTIFTVTIVPPICYFYSLGYISENQAFYSVTLATFALMMLYAMSIYLRRIIGFIYLHRDGTKIKVAHLTFWGKRQEQSIPVSDVVPIGESGDKPTEIMLLLRRYSSTQKLYFSLKYGQMTDRDKFCEVFGNL
ncbi:transmembrane protein 186-like [Asterias rubens]|uniref:transmembrane protein 186-like n=1 Tax=Asterias rubens TaxID=7604 RepID=UPI0014555F48|nr:transmembrane protein 186-like [Asterias rubens]XP_033633703.1 transmembrane protein 186-like [Asterias rubens]